MCSVALPAFSFFCPLVSICARKNCLCWLVAFQRQKRRSVQIKHAREGISPLVRWGGGGGGGGGYRACARACVQACPTRGVRWFWVRGGRASRFEGGCSVSRNRGQALHSPSRPAPPFSALAKPDPPPPPPSLGRRRKKKEGRSRIGTYGGRVLEDHTTPHRGASTAIAAFYPPGTPSLCRCCTHPYRALASTSLVSSLGFSALVFSGFSAAGPPRDCQTRKKKKKKLF